jgi:hypothetical protein
MLNTLPVLQSGTYEEFLQVCCGHAPAADFLHKMIFSLHFFDDCMDGDREVHQLEIYQALQYVMVDIPSNPFYQDNFAALNSDLQTAIINWRVANELEEAQGANDLGIAFICRSEYVNLILKTALLCGGPDWVAKIAPTVRRFAHSEGFANYLESLKHERRAP